MIGDDVKTLVKISLHRGLVAGYMRKLASRIEARADSHDLSKLSAGEFDGFVEINEIPSKYKYGSSEYKAAIDTSAVALHFSRNSHHPENHENGVRDMGLADFIEMVLDWQAASETYGKSTFEESLAIQIERFNLEERHLYLIDLIRRELEITC